MRTPVPAIVYRPTRSAPATLLALLLLIVGGLGTWLTAYRFLTGAWPQRAVATLDAVGTVSFSSIAALIAAGIAAVCGLLMLVAALWPGHPKHVAFLPDVIPGQTALHRSDLAILVKRHVEQIATIRSASATVHRSRVDVVVFSDADDLDAVREAASKKTNEALEVFQPVGITHGRVRAKRVR